MIPKPGACQKLPPSAIVSNAGAFQALPLRAPKSHMCPLPSLGFSDQQDLASLNGGESQGVSDEGVPQFDYNSEGGSSESGILTVGIPKTSEIPKAGIPKIRKTHHWDSLRQRF